MKLTPHPHVSGYFWIRNFFFTGTASVHTYPMNPAEESVPFWIRSLEWKFLNTLWIRNRVEAKSGYFLIRWSNKIGPNSLAWILYSRWQPRSQVLSWQSKMQISRALRRMFRCQYFHSRSQSFQRSPGYYRVNPDTRRIILIWIRIRVDVKILQSGKKQLRIQKYQDNVWTGPIALSTSIRIFLKREIFSLLSLPVTLKGRFN